MTEEQSRRLGWGGPRGSNDALRLIVLGRRRDGTTSGAPIPIVVGTDMCRSTAILAREESALALSIRVTWAPETLHARPPDQHGSLWPGGVEGPARRVEEFVRLIRLLAMLIADIRGRYRGARMRCSLSTSTERAPGAAGADRTPARLPCKVSSYRPGPSKRRLIRKFQ